MVEISKIRVSKKVEILVADELRAAHIHVFNLPDDQQLAIAEAIIIATELLVAKMKELIR